MRALESPCQLNLSSRIVRFNPFVPNEGVGMQGKLLPEEQELGFNPFVPNEGVGIAINMELEIMGLEFQSFCAE